MALFGEHEREKSRKNPGPVLAAATSQTVTGSGSRGALPSLGRQTIQFTISAVPANVDDVHLERLARTLGLARGAANFSGSKSFMRKKPPKPSDREPSPRFKTRPSSDGYSKAVEAVRKLADLELDHIAMGALLERLPELDDRSFATLRAANIENALELAIETKLTIHDGEKRNLYRSDGPLGSFSSKITLGFALNLYGPKTKRNLDAIRHIRNAFAHAQNAISFKDDAMSVLCKYLTPMNLKSKSGDPIQFGSGDAKALVNACGMVLEIYLVHAVNKHKDQILVALGGKSNMQELRFVYDDILP